MKKNDFKYIFHLILLSGIIGYGQFSWGFPPPEGLRLDHYRAPTPDSVQGAETINTEQLQHLLSQQKTVLIDVMAVARRPSSELFDKNDDVWLLSKPRLHIPHSIWLPNVGYGTLEDEMEKYFRHYLDKATQQQQAIIFYCVADCWMSWNACKRAHAWGYKKLYWYREGTDAWEQAGLPTVLGKPEPLHFLKE